MQIIIIGGERHGETEQIPEPTRVAAVVRIMRRPKVEDYSQPDRLTRDRECYEEYTVRNFGIKGTRRRMHYLVLQSLTSAEAERLIDRYESRHCGSNL